MYRCYDDIISVVVPLTVINMAGTCFMMLMFRIVENCLKETIIPNNSIKRSHRSSHRSSYIRSFSAEPRLMTHFKGNVNDSDTKIITENVNDRDNKIITENVNDSDSFIITEIREAQKDIEVQATHKELTNNSLEDTAESLIDLAKTIASVIKDSPVFPDDKKQMMSGLLDKLPDVMTKMLDTDRDEDPVELTELIQMLAGFKSGTNLTSEEHREYFKSLQSLELKIIPNTKSPNSKSSNTKSSNSKSSNTKSPNTKSPNSNSSDVRETLLTAYDELNDKQIKQD